MFVNVGGMRIFLDFGGRLSDSKCHFLTCTAQLYMTFSIEALNILGAIQGSHATSTTLRTDCQDRWEPISHAVTKSLG
jgi:hypothetical protein